MKLWLISAIVCFSAVFSAAKINTSDDSYIRYRAECQIETKLSDVSLAKTILNEPVDDPKIGETAVCVLKKYGSMDGNGELQMDQIRKAAERAFGANASEFVKQCAVKKNSSGETAVNMIRCWKKHNLSL